MSDYIYFLLPICWCAFLLFFGIVLSAWLIITHEIKNRWAKLSILIALPIIIVYFAPPFPIHTQTYCSCNQTTEESKKWTNQYGTKAHHHMSDGGVHTSIIVLQIMYGAGGTENGGVTLAILVIAPPPLLIMLIANLKFLIGSNGQTTTPRTREFRALIRGMEMSNRVWHKGPPPYVGWWNASDCHNHNSWRWWNGKYWSWAYFPDETPHCPPEKSLCFIPNEWTDYWPENARVPRIDPRVNDLSNPFKIARTMVLDRVLKFQERQEFNPGTEKWANLKISCTFYWSLHVDCHAAKKHYSLRMEDSFKKRLTITSNYAIMYTY